MPQSTIPLAVLDLAPVVKGATPADAFRNTLDLAQHVEGWGYRRTFRPSRSLETPYAMPALNAIAADTDDDAQRLFKSVQQQFINLRRGMPGRLQSPDEVNDAEWTPEDRHSLGRVLRYAVVGSVETVRKGLEQFIELTGADELMVTSQIFDHQARLRSFELVAEARKATTQAG